jgi:hypothetical protein
MLIVKASILSHLKRSTFHFNSFIFKVTIGLPELVDEQLLNGGNVDDDAGGSHLKMDHLWSKARDLVPHCQFFGRISWKNKKKVFYFELMK